MELSTSVQYIKGVGPKTAQRFAKLGVETAGQLLELYPRDYVDYSRPYPVASAPYEGSCVVKATVYSKQGEVRVNGGKRMCKVLAGDETAMLELVWFNNPYTAEKLEIGAEYLFFGRVGGNFGKRQMIAPVVQPATGGQPLTAVYPQTEGLHSAYIARCVAAVLEGLQGQIPDPLPPDILHRYRLPGKAQALAAIHRPQTMDQVKAARRRLIYEELLTLQLGILLLRSRGRKGDAAAIRAADLEPFFASLPFSPTDAQRRASGEILSDMSHSRPMNRLLQGDVGSGKTLVAAAAVYAASRAGFQSALMAPTEILATQHAATLQKLLAPFGVEVALLTGGMRAAARRQTLAAIADGRAQLVVGTHAVLSEGVEFSNLALAITDEQHRFGVRQRQLLAAKARSPHLLVMSATPIPRTLALLLYGELDISVLDQLPPGRQPVKTLAITGKKRGDMFGFLNKQIAAGRQVYFVCPLIEESEGAAGEMQSATAYLEQTVQPLLPGRRIGLMHGRLKPKEKQAVMDAFKAGELDALVSTTVIEVGVDVPNATVMVIENAERYGLSALHQLRGRVGRGGGESWCILVSDHQSEAVRQRLQFLCHTSDGFAIARYDLENRGPGDFFGKRQHGLPALKLADLMTDTRTLQAAQQDAAALLAADPRLDSWPALADQVQRLFEQNTAMN